jgi:hypothetical protein
MPVHVTKAEDRLKPIVFLERAKANWVTVVDKAANWTPWAKKGDGEVALSFDDLEGNGGALNELQPGARAGRLKTIEMELNQLLEEQSNILATQKGDNNMAGEIIQSIVGPIDKDINSLKGILGAEQFALLNTTKAEKHDRDAYYEQLPAEKFEKLAEANIGNTGFKAIIGKLKDAGAEKGSMQVTIPTPWAPETMIAEDPADDNRRPFQSVMWDKQRAMEGAIKSAIELEEDPAVIKAKVQEAVKGYSNWLDSALDQMAAQMPVIKSASGEAAKKAEEGKQEPEKKGLISRVADRFRRNTDNPGASAAEKGDEEMEISKELIREVMEEVGPSIAAKAAEATVKDMVQKAEEEEARKAEEAKNSDEAKKADQFMARMTGMLDWFEAKKAEEEAEAEAKKGEGGEAEVDPKAAELEAAKAELKEAQEKLDAIVRSPGAPSKPENKKPAVKAETEESFTDSASVAEKAEKGLKAFDDEDFLLPGKGK